jgi:signal transduction histidine kinase
MDGQVSARPNPDRGSTFVVRVPAATDVLTRGADPAPVR